MPSIVVRELRKVYQVKRKAPGFVGSLRALWRPEYSPITAVDGISFQIDSGEAVGFVGPNGAGKSTTIKMLAGLLYPTSGRLQVLGMVPWQERQQLAFRIASVFGQRSQLWYHLPPGDSFDLLAEIYELDPAEYRIRRQRLIERFAIEPYLDIPVRRLSLGERMRCEIVAALLHRPAIIFLDEPTIGLDVIARQEIRAMIRDLNRDAGVTILLTSHDAGDIEQVCQRVMVINRGSLVFDSSVDALKRRFLRKKVIELRLADETATVAIPGVSIVETGPYFVRLEVDIDLLPVERVVSHLVSSYRVADLTIEEPPLEEVIAAIYRATGRPSMEDEHVAPGA